MAENVLNEETFNLELRKFLKKVGVNSQREIERAVRDAVKSGTLKSSERLHAQMTLSISRIKLTYVIEEEIALS